MGDVLSDINKGENDEKLMVELSKSMGVVGIGGLGIMEK
jgi:hypothetical protein